MATLPDQEFGAFNTNPPTLEYPNGSYKNETVPNVSQDGTPVTAKILNDMLGADEALYAEVGMTPTNITDTALSSQKLDALRLLAGKTALRPVLIAQGLSGGYGFFADGFTYNLAGDVGIDTDGKIYTYVGSDPLPVNVAPETDPVGDTDYKLFNLDSIYERKVTLADALLERTNIGTNYTVTDRDNHPFIKTSGESSNGIDIISTDDGNQLKIKVNSLSECSLKALGWSFGVDAAPIIKRAAEIGIKKLKLPKGGILCSQVDLDSNFQTMEIKGVGSGFAYTPQTTIAPFSPAQTDIFVSQSGVGGVDNVKFKGVYLNGQDTCDYGVRQLSGAGWEFEDIQTDNFNEWAIYGEQGLNKYERMFIRSDRITGTGGLAVYSDSFINNIECTGGGVGLWLMAGGNRIGSVLSNGQSESCILIKPLDASTNHINTAFTNVYVGEVYNSSVKSQIKIESTGASRPRDIQFSNLHTVSAAATGEKHNIHVEVINSDRITFNAWQGLGIGDFETANLYDAGGLKAVNSTEIKLASGCLTNMSQAPIEVINSDVVIGDTFTIKDWGSEIITDPIRRAGVICQDSTSKITIGDVEFRNERKSGYKAGYFSDGSVLTCGTFMCNMFGTTPATMFTFNSKPAAYQARQNTQTTIYVYGRRISAFGEFSSPAGGGNVANIFEIPDIADDTSYSISIQQKGTGANATLGKAFANSTATGVVTLGNTNSTAVLQNTFSISGLDISVDIGTGYGATTWVYQYTREL